ncbi:hypothetical protein SISSUDRAFT_1043141 [Sistotremastrum suecicum HHB10207 ss-3]|uniref:Uncharacterized protein n=1 Tax=Sistotremastrum suecicum HHB10207 ss-3 TaxID=1314776 RepID=A0A166G4L3_9AGAM|nr:hypothetical protein SISSUDRAFT_1043141 [Sistotremastrum suecicum HHB10207 ss-3]
MQAYEAVTYSLSYSLSVFMTGLIIALQRQTQPTRLRHSTIPYTGGSAHSLLLNQCCGLVVSLSSLSDASFMSSCRCCQVLVSCR